MTQPPTAINYYAKDRALEITWAAGQVARLSTRKLRGSCGCAACVDERTGQRILDVDAVAEDIDIVSMHPVGNYALHITWSDGHDSGFYSWEHLRRLTAEGDR